MGCCLFFILIAGAPRVAFLFLWLFRPLMVSRAFDNMFVPILGVIILPWVTIIYTIVAPGGINGFEWVLLGVGLLFDIGSYGGGGGAARKRKSD